MFIVVDLRRFLKAAFFSLSTMYLAREIMNEDMANMIVTKVVPVILTAAIIWMATSINEMQVGSARIEVQVTEIYKLMQLSSTDIDRLDQKLTMTQLELSLLQQRVNHLESSVSHQRSGDRNVSED